MNASQVKKLGISDLVHINLIQSGPYQELPSPYGQDLALSSQNDQQQAWTMVARTAGPVKIRTTDRSEKIWTINIIWSILYVDVLTFYLISLSSS